MASIFRLWGLYARMDLLWMVRNPRIGLMWYVCDALVNVSAIAGMLLLAERFAGVGRWSRPQLIFMLGYATLTSGIVESMFGYNVAYISRRLGRGQFDHVLIQPRPVWLTLLTEGFIPFSASGTLVAGGALLVWAGARLAVPASGGWWGLFVLNLLASVVVMVSFAFLWGSLAFWAPRAAEEVSGSALHLLERLKSFPLDGIAPALAGGLLTLVPAGFIAWYPCRSLLGVGRPAWHVAVTPLAALSLSALATVAFRLGMRQHARTGSQRYSGFAHRA